MSTDTVTLNFCRSDKSLQPCRTVPRHPAPFRFARIYRAFVQPAADSRRPEITAFVEAAGHHAAIRKIANTVAALEGCLPETVMENRIYNCSSARELVDEGLSTDIELRLFETGWSGNEAVSFVTEPLFLLAAPAALIRVWASIAGEVSA
jgi:hypothetical protein